MRGLLRSLGRPSSFSVRGSRRRRNSALGGVQLEALETRALLAAQIISSDAPVKTVAEGESVDVPVVYQTLDDQGNPAALQATRLNFNLHFDADLLSLVSVREIEQEDLVTTPATPRPESDPLVVGDDNDASTETALTASYVDTTGPAGWPNAPVSGGTVIYIARFTALAGFVETNINFSINESADLVGGSGTFEFQSNPVTLQSPAGPTVSVSDATPVTEGGDATFNVSLNAAASDPITVTFSTEEGNGPSGALNNEDFTPQTNQTLTFAPGEVSKTITVQTVDDFTIEGDETFGVILQSATGATIRGPRGTATILDDDAGLPALIISDAGTVPEGDNATFVVTLDQASTEIITVDYETRDGNGPLGATNGSDFPTTNGTLTFNPGETQKAIIVPTIDDSFAEPNEVFGVELVAASQARISTALGEATISDNDSGLPELSISDAATVTEGGLSTFTVTLAEASTEVVTVSVSTSDGTGPTGATQGVDFVGLSNQTVTFAVGETQQTFSVTTIDDATAETTEAFVVTLSDANNASIGVPQAVGIIQDNESSATGDVDGDDDFDANDSFLIHLTKLAGTNAQIDRSKGASPKTAAEIRTAINALSTAGDVDGDSDFDANDSFLIHLVKLAGTNTQIDRSKGASVLTAAEIRDRINALSPPAGQGQGDDAGGGQGQGRSSGGQGGSQAGVQAGDPDDDQNQLFGDSDDGDSGNSSADANDYDDTSFDDAWGDYRGWLNAL